MAESLRDYFILPPENEKELDKRLAIRMGFQFPTFSEEERANLRENLVH